ncbi:hypothetical protein AB7M33_000665 [Pseudomonas sp. Y3 TE3536]
MCCEEARGSSEDLVCCHRPLRSTRLLLQGRRFTADSGWLPTAPPLPCRCLRPQPLRPPVGAALCCEEALSSSEDLVCCHRPLRSTRLLLQGGAFHRRFGWLPTDPPLPCRFLQAQPLRPPVGAALCCEEARGSSEDLVCCHRPLRSTRCSYRGVRFTADSGGYQRPRRCPVVSSRPSHCAHR